MVKVYYKKKFSYIKEIKNSHNTFLLAKLHWIYSSLSRLGSFILCVWKMNSEQQINVSEAYTLELLQTGYVLIIKQHQQYSESRSTCTEEKNTSVVNIRKWK